MMRRVVLFLSAVGVFAADGFGQNWPSKGIKFVVPLNAGSPIDASARVIAQHLQSKLGQSIVVENRPGAGTTVGTRAVTTADPDGHTFLFSGVSIAFFSYLYPHLDIDPIRSLTPIATIGKFSHVLAIAPSVPATNVAQLVSYAKANPGKLIFGFGLGTAPHMLGATLKEVAGIDITFLPYRGGEQARTDLLGGRVHINIAPGPSLIPLVLDGKARAIAVTGAKRRGDLPEVPTMIESGYPQVGYHPDVWIGMLGPSGTPSSIIQRLNREVNASLTSDAVRAAFEKMDIEPMPMSQAEYARFLSDEMQKWPPRLKAAGLKSE